MARKAVAAAKGNKVYMTTIYEPGAHQALREHAFARGMSPNKLVAQIVVDWLAEREAEESESGAR